MITVYGYRTENSKAIGLTEKGKEALEDVEGFEIFEKEIKEGPIQNER